MDKNILIHYYNGKIFVNFKTLLTFATANEKDWCHSSVGRAKD